MIPSFQTNGNLPQEFTMRLGQKSPRALDTPHTDFDCSQDCSMQHKPYTKQAVNGYSSMEVLLPAKHNQTTLILVTTTTTSTTFYSSNSNQVWWTSATAAPHKKPDFTANSFPLEPLPTVQDNNSKISLDTTATTRTKALFDCTYQSSSERSFYDRE